MKDSVDQSILPLERLKIRRQFLAVAASGKKSVTPGLILQARPQILQEKSQILGAKPLALTSDAGAGNAVIRIGFTASKKVGGAVERNRARRRLKALASEVMAQHAGAAYDYVVIARRETLTRPYDKLRQDMAGALQRLKLYRPLNGKTGGML